MSKDSLIEPSLNVEYTFIFDNGKRCTLRFIGKDDNGKLLFLNLKTKKPTKPWTLQRFDFVFEHNLVNSIYCDKPLKHYLEKKNNLNNIAPTQSNVSEKESRLLKAFSMLSDLEQDKLIADAEFYSMRHRSKLKQ